MRNSALLLVLAPLLTSCAPKTYVVMPEYQGKKAAAASVGVYLVAEQIVIQNPDDVADDLGRGVPEEVYLTHFNEQFPKALRTSTHCSSARFLGKDDLAGFSERALALESGPLIKISLPREGVTLPGGQDLDYLILVENVHVWSEKMLGLNAKLWTTFEYAVWDNRAGKLVSYGVNKAFAPCIGGVMAKYVWVQSVATMAIQSTAGTPLEKAPYSSPN